MRKEKRVTDRKKRKESERGRDRGGTVNWDHVLEKGKCDETDIRQIVMRERTRKEDEGGRKSIGALKDILV